MDIQSKKILVAEDEKPLLRALQLKLSSSGYTVSVALNGEEAIGLLSKNKFDLILLDLIMPKVDGYGVLAKIKELGIATPVIVLSNLSQREDFAKSGQMGATAYFTKSDTPLVELVAHIEKILGKV